MSGASRNTSILMCRRMRMSAGVVAFAVFVPLFGGGAMPVRGFSPFFVQGKWQDSFIWPLYVTGEPGARVLSA